MAEDRKSQLDKFKAAARDMSADVSEDALDAIIDKLDLKRTPPPRPQEGDDEKK